MSAGIIAAHHAPAGAIAGLGNSVDWWLQGDDLPGPDGAHITGAASWPDKSNAARALASADFRKKTNATPNGNSAADFGIYAGNGFANNYVTLANLYSGATEGEFWAVVKAPTPVSGGVTGAIFQVSNAAGGLTHYPYSDGNFYNGILRNTRVAIGGLSLSGWHVLRVSSGATWKVDINGVTKYSAATGVFVAPTTTQIGSAGISDKAEVGTYVAEIVSFKRVLTAAEATSVLQELYFRNLGVPVEPFEPTSITYSGSGSPTIDPFMPTGAKMYLFTWEYTRLQGLDGTAPTVSGWSLVTKGNTGTGDGGGIRMCCFERTCQAGDAGSQVSPGYQAASGLWAYAAVVGYDTLLSHDTATAHVPGATSTAVTTTVPNQKILYAIGAYRSNGGAGLSIINPAGGVVTDVVAAGDVSDTHGAVKIAQETQASAGTSTVRTWTEANGVGGSEMGVLAIPVRV